MSGTFPDLCLEGMSVCADGPLHCHLLRGHTWGPRACREQVGKGRGTRSRRPPRPPKLRPSSQQSLGPAELSHPALSPALTSTHSLTPGPPLRGCCHMRKCRQSSGSTGDARKTKTSRLARAPAARPESGTFVPSVSSEASPCLRGLWHSTVAPPLPRTVSSQHLTNPRPKPAVQDHLHFPEKRPGF